jgi:hypothetical protein
MDRALLRSSRWLSGALVLHLAGAPAADAQQTADRILAAIVRQDGVVVPFAEYRGGTDLDRAR